jgi:hypothetical protein
MTLQSPQQNSDANNKQIPLQTDHTWHSKMGVYAGIVIIIIPILIQGIYIARYGVNSLIADEWDWVPFIKTVFTGGNWLAMLFNQHNEHRMASLRIILAILTPLTSWNVIVEMYFSLFLECLILSGLWLIYRRICGNKVWGFIPIAWLTFSLGQYGNYLYGMQIVFYTMVVCVVWSIYFLSCHTGRTLALAIVCALISSFSISSGLFVWPTGLLYLILSRSKKSHLAIWLLIGIATFVFYFINYISPPNPPSTMFATPLHALLFMLANMGAPLGGGDFNFSFAIGLGLVGCLGWYLFWQLRNRSWPSLEDSLAISLVAVSLLTSLAVTYGRIAFGMEWALTSRYTSITMLGVIGVYVLLARKRFYSVPRNFAGFQPEKLFNASLAIFFVGIVATNLYGNYEAKHWSQGRTYEKFVLQTIDQQNDKAVSTLYHTPRDVRIHSVFLKQYKLNAFNDIPTILLATNTEAGKATQEILPNQPVTENLTCSVQTLHDLSIPFSTLGRKNSSTIKVTIGQAGNLLAEQIIDTSKIANNSWITTRLNSPLQNCNGKNLSITVQSTDATQGNAVAVWTYPAYYDGVLQQSNNNELADMSMGLQLNAAYYGFVQ